MTVALVIVSHSVKIAEGIVELAGQMAPGVTIVAAGGTDDAGIGTSFDKVSSAVAEADDGSGVVVLCDLGSAILTAETALDFLDDAVRQRVRIADCPIVEGAVAAAVAAEIGGELDAVVAAAETSAAPLNVGTPPPDGGRNVVGSGGSDKSGESGELRDEHVSGGQQSGEIAAVATLINASGLHARPAAEFVRRASEFDAKINVNGVDAKSLLSIMALGLGRGTEVRVAATGPEAQAAVDALTELIGSGFGE